MAPEMQHDQLSPTRPIAIAGRTDIAKVVFYDGHSINFPSVASVASPLPSSYATSASNFRSRSSSRKRGRNRRGRSLSSTSSNPFSAQSMPSMSDDSASDHQLALTALACSPTDALLPPPNQLDHVGVGEEWTSQAMPLDGLWATDLSCHTAAQNQDHLVTKADGAHCELPSHPGDMDTALDIFLSPRKLSDPSDVVSDAPGFGSLPGPQSAPVASGWMHHAVDNGVPLAAASKAERNRSIDLSHISVSKIARKPGRAPGSKLPEEKRRKIAAMRQVGACNYCREGRRGCDRGTPCRPCILHFGADVLEKPNICRRDIIQYLCSQILAKTCKWHPYPRDMGDFFGRDFYVTDWRIEIPVQFSFGPYLKCSVQVLKTSDPSYFQHKHVHYTSSVSDTPEVSHDYVLPAVFTDASQLFSAVDSHLSVLVNEHLTRFTPFHSKLRILDKIFKLYTHYSQGCYEHATLLHQALKFLVLVHNSEFSVPTNDASVARILSNAAPGYKGGSQRVTACILRAEFGKVLPQLARIILEDVLKKLLRICLSRRCDQHPTVVATFCVLMMAIESIMYHSSRIGYHAHSTLPGPSTRKSNAKEADGKTFNPFASTTHPIEAAAALEKLESAAWELQTIYRNCFENCHRLLLESIDERHFSGLQKSLGETPAAFIAALNQAIREAGGYLEKRVAEKDNTLSGSSRVFDRLLARLFLLQTGPY